jgi:phosphopantetheine adenylyltransferase
MEGSTMNCKQCGESIPNGSLFCANCGSRIESVDESKHASPVVTTATTLESASETGSSPVSEAKAFVAEQSEQSVKPSTVGTISRVAFSILLGIFTFAFVVVFIALTVVRPTNIPNIIGRAEISRIIEDIGLTNEVVSEINDSIIIDISFDIDGIKDFLKRDTVSAEISKVAERYVTAITDSDFDYHITAREVVGFVRSVASDIRDEFGYRLTNEDYDMITESLNAEINLKDFRIGKLMENAGMNNAVPYLLLSVYPLIIVGVICVLLVFNIFMLNRKKVRAAFMITAIPFILSGLIYSVAGLLLGPFSGLLANSGIYNYVRVVAGIANLVLFPGIICLGIGVLTFAVYFVIKKLRKQPIVINYDAKRNKLWRMTGLITNMSLVITCAVCALLCYLNLP